MAESITITDNRNGESIEIPLVNGGVAAEQWAKLLPGVWFYDPAFMSTAACESSITYLDGDEGILRYRGYPIEQLAENSTYLEVAYLLLNGELPTADAVRRVDPRDHVPHLHPRERAQALPRGLPLRRPSDGHARIGRGRALDLLPRGQGHLRSESRYKQIIRLIAKMPTLAAAAHRFSVGMPFVYPDNSLDFPPNFLSMMWKVGGAAFRRQPGTGPCPRRPVHPARRSRAELLDHGHARRRLVPRRPVLGLCRCRGRLYGPRHGGANEEVIRMLTVDRLAGERARLHRVGEGGHRRQRLQGFGHRVYKNYDPRAKIIQRSPTTCSTSPARTPSSTSPSSSKRPRWRRVLHVAALYPNVDFYSGLIYQAMGFPMEMFPVLFAIPRTAGLARPLAGDARPRHEDRPAPPALHRLRGARLRPDAEPLTISRPSPRCACGPGPPGPARRTRRPCRSNRKPRARPRPWAATGESVS